MKFSPLKVHAVVFAACCAAGAAMATETGSGASAPDPVVSNVRQALEQGMLEIDFRLVSVPD